jgi:hypothetical protein
LKGISDLAGDSADDILNNRPTLKNKLGGSIDRLKYMGDQFGPEAKKEAGPGHPQGRCWRWRSRAAAEIDSRQDPGDAEGGRPGLAEELEQAKPYLDYSPKVRELVIQNEEILMQDILTEL